MQEYYLRLLKNRACDFIATGEYKEAIKIFRRILNYYDNKDVLLMCYRGASLCADRLGNTRMAIRYYKKALGISRNDLLNHEIKTRIMELKQ